ncbi:MAG TPA: serine/threonine-protein kinase [Acidimicrobiales bacterium]
MTSGERTGPGQAVGPYRLVEPLGRGGMGEVWLAEDPTGAAGGAPRLVAVKLLHPALPADAAVRARFAREVAALRRIASPFVAPLLDADPEAPRPWLASAYVAGPTLADHVARHGPLADGALRALARALVEALVAIHAVGVVHRDLTPRNVVLGPDGPRVVDFGIAWFPGAVPVTQGGAAVGTPAWMAPERLAAGGGEATPASDVWSWGAVMAYAAGGDRAVADGEAGAGGGAAHAPGARGGAADGGIGGGAGSAAAGGSPRLPGWLEPTVRAATAADPAARPTAIQLLAALDAAAPADRPSPATPATAGFSAPDTGQAPPGGPAASGAGPSPSTTAGRSGRPGGTDATRVLPGATTAGQAAPPAATTAGRSGRPGGTDATPDAAGTAAAGTSSPATPGHGGPDDQDATQVIPDGPAAGPGTPPRGATGPGTSGPDDQDATQVIAGGPRASEGRRARRLASLVSAAAVIAAALAVGAAVELLAAILIAAVVVLVALVLRHRRTRVRTTATRRRSQAADDRPRPAIPPTWTVALAAPAVVGAALVGSLGLALGLAALAVLVVVFVLVAGDLA